MSAIYDDAPGFQAGVPSIYAWVAIDAMGGEGIAGGMVPGLAAVPFVASTEEQARLIFTPMIDSMIANIGGRRYELRRFDFAEVVETRE